MAAQPTRAAHPLRPSLTRNVVVPQHDMPRAPYTYPKFSRDENSSELLDAPSGGMTLADEFSRAGQRELDKTIVLAELLSAEDVSVIEVALDTVHIDTSDSNDSKAMAMVPSDVALSEEAPGYIMISVDDVTIASETTTQGPYDRGEFAECCHYRQGVHTLRERRLQYLNDMHAILRKPAPRLPKALLNPSASVPGGRKWTIQSGTVGDWRQCPMRKPTEFEAKYHGSAWDCWQAKVDELEVRHPEQKAASQRARAVLQAKKMLLGI